MGYYILEISCQDSDNVREDYFICQTAEDLKRYLYRDLVSPKGMKTVICNDSEINLYVMSSQNKIKDTIELHPFITYKFEGLPQIRFDNIRQMVLFEGFKYYEKMLLNTPYPVDELTTDQEIIVEIVNKFLHAITQRKMVKTGPDRWTYEYRINEISDLDLRYKGDTILVKGSVNWNLLMKKISKINKKQPKKYVLNDYEFKVGVNSML